MPPLSFGPPPNDANAESALVLDAIAAPLRVVVATSDPVFAALCRRALESGKTQTVVTVPLLELLETARELQPDRIVLDADVQAASAESANTGGDAAAALTALAAKVMLVSDAPVVLVSAYLGPGAPDLCALLQSIAATFVQKPSGPSSLSLAAAGGPPFVAALEAAFAGREDEDLPPESLDADWDTGDGTTTANRSRG
jgi:CheY-like chemotaxis protein